jgi:hypothetical protein
MVQARPHMRLHSDTRPLPEVASRLRFEGVSVRRIKMKPIKPVEMVYSYRKDNDNPILETFREEILGTEAQS